MVTGQVIDPTTGVRIVGDDCASVNPLAEDCFQSVGDARGRFPATYDEHPIKRFEIVARVADDQHLSI
jgi:hypothetical protein